MPWYRSSRMADNKLPWKLYGTPSPPPTYQCVFGWPRSCACPSRIAIVGEGPGQEEDLTGIPFIGRTGEEVDRFLDTYGFDPDRTFMTNIGRVFRYGNPDPTEDDVAIWEPLLHEELNAAKPYWIAALGRVSTRYFLGDVDMDAVHGVPYVVVLPWLDNGRGGTVTVVPIVHPAAGFHNPEAQADTAYDFQVLDAVIGGRVAPRQAEFADRFPTPEYRDLTDDDAQFIGNILASRQAVSFDGPAPIAIDTEGLPGNPWGLSFSLEPGVAYVIRKQYRVALAAFYFNLISGINDGTIHVILHNSLHDLRVLRELGIPLPDNSFTDTMVLAYHLCIEPQGLKALAYRHAGMVMESYEDVISEAQDQIAVEYYAIMKSICDGEEEKFEYGEVILNPNGKPKKKGGVIQREVLRRWVEGGFGQIEPYGVQVRNPKTGQLEAKTKKPKQIKFRVDKAWEAYEAGELTPAGMRKRWEGTDEMVTDLVEDMIGPMREAGLDDVPLERAIRYSARDADATVRVYGALKERHAAWGLGPVSDIDHAIIPMVDRMQATGLIINREYFEWLSGDLKRRMTEKQEEIKAKCGVWLNPNSGEQVADLLFTPVEKGGYGLIPTKLTKGKIDPETGQVKGRRGSTVDKVLMGMQDAHPIIPMITEYRGLLKAKTSFVDVALRKARYEDVPVEWDAETDQPIAWKKMWVVHCNFRITRVSSGRLSATGPNLMAVMGGALGYEIRRGYEAGEGWEFAEWDLNQIEMRVMASEANDEFLIGMFNRDEDVHAGTADKMFVLRLPRPYHKKQVSKDQRDAAKRTGFGVITGIQAKGLVDQMRLQGRIVTEDEAAKWITDWFAACPSVPIYMESCRQDARSTGFIRDWMGRIRYLPGIHSPFKHIRAEAGRQSHSHKIQAGAQEIMKLAMAIIWREVLPYWWAQKHQVQPVLQIHDALMVKRRKMNPKQAADMDAQVRAAMFQSAPPGFKVSLDAGTVVADNWGDMEH